MKTIPTTSENRKNERASARGQARISCPPQIVTGLDKLEVTLWLSCEDRELYSKLSRMKKDCQALDLPLIPINFGDKKIFNWNLKRTGTKQYGFVLQSGDITLQLSTRDHESNYANCRIEIGSISCQEHSIRIYDRLIQWLELYGLKREKELVSRVDLAVDLIGANIQELDVFNRRKWICRATKMGLYMEGYDFSGMMLGKGSICLRIYNKTLELRNNKTKQDFFQSLWKCEKDIPVTRVEFQFRREIMKEMKIQMDTVAELEKNVDSLWQYASKKWARLASQSIDQKNNNQKRAEISEIWTRIQGALFSFPQMANIREKKTLTKNLLALRDQARGCILNLAAAVGHDEDDFYGIIQTCSEAISNDLAAFMSDRYNDYIKLFKIRRNQCYVGF